MASFSLLDLCTASTLAAISSLLAFSSTLILAFGWTVLAGAAPSSVYGFGMDIGSSPSGGGSRTAPGSGLVLVPSSQGHFAGSPPRSGLTSTTFGGDWAGAESDPICSR